MHPFTFLTTLLITGLLFSNKLEAQTTADKDVIESFTYDTSTVDVFKGADTIKFKLDYYHTEGYSMRDRYSYEIIILDSLMILNFRSPDNEDWNYISYQKQQLLSDSVLNDIKSQINLLHIQQKKKGIPDPNCSGYGANRLFIETKDLHIAGGDVYGNIFSDSDTDTQINEKIKKECEASSSISGDYETLLKKLEGLFTGLDFLLKDKNI